MGIEESGLPFIDFDFLIQILVPIMIGDAIRPSSPIVRLKTRGRQLNSLPDQRRDRSCGEPLYSFSPLRE
jgi:hypothetical protein